MEARWKPGDQLAHLASRCGGPTELLLGTAVQRDDRPELSAAFADVTRTATRVAEASRLFEDRLLMLVVLRAWARRTASSSLDGVWTKPSLCRPRILPEFDW